MKFEGEEDGESEDYFALKRILEGFDTKLVFCLLLYSEDEAALKETVSSLSRADVEVCFSRTKSYDKTAHWIATLWSKVVHLENAGFEDLPTSIYSEIGNQLGSLGSLPSRVSGQLNVSVWYGERFGNIALPAGLIAQLGDAKFEIKISGELSA